MRRGWLIGGAALLGSAAVLGQFTASALPRPDSEGGVAAGPDVIVGAIPNVSAYGSVGGIAAYAFGTTSCNIGDTNLLWIQNTNQHPVIPQNAYRIKNGRIEQIGMSWIKHGFCALQQSLCGPCTPAGGGCYWALGVGCSDPYSSSLNGTTSYLGPRSQVNASTGVFPYPFSAPAAPPTIGRRCQILNSDLDPSLNPGAIYVAEGHYVHPEDAASGNGDNNASHRVFTVGSWNAADGGYYNLLLTGGTIQQKPAIYHWQTVHPDVIINKVTADGSFFVGSRAIANGDGTWRYEYAIFNMNSDRSGASFTVPVPKGVEITNIGFRDVPYHSGEPYDGTDWSATITCDSITWACPQTFAQNANANALRWSTMYSFWFTANAEPVDGDAALGLFKPGTPDSLTVVVKGPSSPPYSPADLDQNGWVDGSDLGELLGQWGLCSGCPADLNCDGQVDGGDLGALLGQWN